jgi:hypothetical protein
MTQSFNIRELQPPTTIAIHLITMNLQKFNEVLLDETYKIDLLNLNYNTNHI